LNKSEKRDLHGLLKRLGLSAAGTLAESDRTEIST
jgi:hypothetical protein